ncbi:hypothetical protein F8388_014459 [Cannabis sativa]|uniref:PGG domain-containing protein n=1 Tax=Cannabis sativa TaxID=3483 RepID=A0A7J6FYS6_CANSA|nr:hypothetical protein G4B88_012877 [Cannabis sativa]KAF4375737.1 hypothetical protein F8388_014459 [Cannabis sativa]
MEKVFSMLYEAAQEGNVTTLRQLLKQDKLILDRLIVINNNGFTETPLHVAAMLGHADFVREIITYKPELAKEVDAWHSTPLHLAVAKGHLETVKVLLMLVDDRENLCFAWDGEGRNPMHLAAMRGRLDVLRELLKVAPEAGRINLKDRNETILHVCVRHNQLEALKLLVSAMDGDYQFVNAKDDYGMTILHLATVKFLVTNTRVEVNATNTNKFTTFDILAQSQRSEKDFDISESLRSVGASQTIDQSLLTKKHIHHHHHHGNSNNQKENQEDKTAKKSESWLSRKRESLMIVASLIATMAFQAGTTPPGGLWQESSPSQSISQVTQHDTIIDRIIADSPSVFDHLAGEAIIASYHDKKFLYHIYLFCNTVGFVGSLSIILLLVTGLPFCRRFWMWILTVTLWITLTAMTLTYVVAIWVAAPEKDINNIVKYLISYLILIWAGVMAVIVVLHTIRLIIKLLKWLGNLILGGIKRNKEIMCI